MFYIERTNKPEEGASTTMLQAMGIEHHEPEPEQYADAATAAQKACVLSAMQGVDCEVIQQRARDRVVVARASRGIVTSITPPAEPPAPDHLADTMKKGFASLITTIKEKY